MISKRLQQIASYISPYNRVADIGSDHAWLLVHLSMQNRLKRGIAGELNQGPFNNALHRVQQEGLQELIQVRRGDGLQVLQPNEVEVVVIAGMGGQLIEEILDRGKLHLRQVRRLVLQPNQSADRLRRWLRRENWRLVAETIVQEAGVLYEILMAEPGEEGNLYTDTTFTESELEKIGPLLWKEKHPLLLSKMQEEMEHVQRILQELKRVRSQKGKQRRTVLHNEYELGKKVITCLSKETN